MAPGSGGLDKPYIESMTPSSAIALLTGLLIFPAGTPPSLTSPRAAVAAADSFVAVISNRVVLEIKAPASLVWSFLPSIRKRPGMEKVPLNGVTDQVGARFDTIFRDSTGKITRHDRLEVLHWEPGVRYAANVSYLPPAPPLSIVYNVDLRESGGITHFVMDAYATVRLPDPGTAEGRLAAYIADQRQSQESTAQAYEGLKRDIEAAARR